MGLPRTFVGPSDFIEKLNATVEDLQRAELSHISSKGARTSSIADFNETLKDLNRFDTLRDNPGVLAAWNVARRVGRPPATT